MDKLTRGRRAARTQLTKSIKEIEDMLAAEIPDHKALRVSSSLIEKTVTELENWNEKIQELLLDDGASDEGVDKELAEIEKYRRNYRNLKTDLDDFLSTSYTGNSNVDAVSVTGEGRKRKFHLPEVKLKSFGGDLMEWLGWWSQFEKIHQDEELHDTDKFQYLAQAMTVGSEAKDIVDSYPQTESNYGKAVAALQDRFGRQDLLLQVYVRELLTLVIGNVTSKDKLPLSQLFVRLESHLRCLAELNLDKADPATWLFPLVESSLSEETMRAWQRSTQSKTEGSSMVPPKSRLELLMEFMKCEVQCEQQISLAQQGFQSSDYMKTAIATRSKPKARNSLGRKVDNLPTAAGLLNLQSGECGVCGKPHETEKCFTLQKMSLKERRKLVREKKLCYQCLQPGHVKRACKAYVKCSTCRGRHYAIVCHEVGNSGSYDVREESRVTPPSKKRRTEPNTNFSPGFENITRTFHQSSNQCSRRILMNTLKVNVRGKNGQLIPIRLVGDNGSQRSYASLQTLDRANGAWMEDEWLQNILFGGQLTVPKRFPRHEVTIHGLNGGQMTLQLLGKDQITGQICEVPHGPWIDELQAHGIVLTDLGDKSTAADILIGNDYWGSIRTGRMVKLLDGLVAEETVFGWTLGGPLPVRSTNMFAMNMTVGSQEIEKLWNFDAIGIRDSIEVKSALQEDVEAMAHFRETVQREKSGRYVVSLPWKRTPTELPSNLEVAEHRLKAVTYKLQKVGKLDCYHKVFNEWEKEDLVVKIVDAEHGGHYVPHRPVFKDSATTPVRPVFDASCRVGRNPSLNDCLHKGPNLIELIPAMLLRFGVDKIGVSADIRKAFQMIKVNEVDQQFQRFLWWEDQTCKRLVIYQHTRVVFGFTCSPFLLGAVIQHHVDSLGESDLSEKLRSCFYVDNLVTSVKSKEEFKVFKAASVEVLKDAGMELRQWACSMDRGLAWDESTEELVMPVLGVLWNRKTDVLSCVIKEFQFNEVTKRNILSVVAQVFDPVGFLCPALILPKLLVQEAWSNKLGWDKRVPQLAENRFLRWCRDVAVLQQVQIPRYCQVLNATTREVHVFSDSSGYAMATVAFLRTELSGKVALQFLMAKSRLTPVKKPTIPRAELVSCVMGVRVAVCIQNAIKLEKDKFWFWSDSSTALAWIQRQGDWGVFVRNRVNEILDSTTAAQWRHVPGKMNPADLPSRGCSPAALVRSEWWEGPSWLRGCSARFPKSTPATDEQEVTKEAKKSITMMMSASVSDFPKFSSYRRNVAVWGWMLRFIEGCRKRKLSTQSYLTITELRIAEKLLILRLQRDSFPSQCSDVGGLHVYKDAEGILRVKTRLLNRNDNSDFICPILLPKSNALVEMLIREVHRMYCHGGIQFLLSKLREKYWIIQSRRMVRKVVKNCVQCCRHEVKRCEVDPAALPRGRVETAIVFSTTGVDLAGPLFLKDGRKMWIVLYTCALYRAVHLDLVSSLATDTFLMSLERFIGLYGRPNTVYSDNGTNFVGAVNLAKRVDWDEVRERCGIQQIQWIFNPPTAAWWGGWWERLVRSVKDLLKRMLGRTKLSEDELRTCLAGVTSTINDRPLTVVSEDNEDLIPLTPAMFIRPLPSGHFPELANSDFMKKSYIKMKDVQARLQHRFRKEYLSLLVMRTGKKKQSSVAVGDVVLVGADNRKRFEWPLGLIMELLPGKDGKVRVVKVRTANGMLTRPLQRLFPLEMARDEMNALDKGKQSPTVPAELENEPSTRYGRVSRRPVRYGQWMHLVNSKTG